MNFQDFFILGAIFFAFGATLAPTKAHAEVVERLEAIVNKDAIYKSDVDRFRKLVPLRAKVDPMFANDPLAHAQNPTDLEITNYLIDESVIIAKFPVSDSEVEQEINGIQSNMHIDREQLRSAISREGFSFEDYFKLMRASLSKRQLVDRDIRSKSVVSDDDIRAEYNRDKSGSKTFSGTFHLFLVKVNKADYKSSALAKSEAQKISDTAKAGGEFPGEDLGYLAYTDMSPTLQKVVQKIGPQKTSEPVDDGTSYIVVKTGDIKSDGESVSDQDKDRLRSHLMESEFEHQIKLWISRERANNYVRINTQ